MYNKLIGSLFDGYKKAKTPYADKRLKKWAFEDLEETPYLYSSKYLNELHDQATRKDEFESILDHMYRHNVEDIDSYHEIESKIIDKYWR